MIYFILFIRFVMNAIDIKPHKSYNAYISSQFTIDMFLMKHERERRNERMYIMGLTMRSQRVQILLKTKLNHA